MALQGLMSRELYDIELLFKLKQGQAVKGGESGSESKLSSASMAVEVRTRDLSPPKNRANVLATIGVNKNHHCWGKGSNIWWAKQWGGARLTLPTSSRGGSRYPVFVSFDFWRCDHSSFRWKSLKQRWSRTTQMRLSLTKRSGPEVILAHHS